VVVRRGDEKRSKHHLANEKGEKYCYRTTWLMIKGDKGCSSDLVVNDKRWRRML
jgi:hypothetical protein